MMNTTAADKRFLGCFGACSLFLSLSLVALGVHVDPRGTFGTSKYPVLVATCRVEKLMLLTAAHPKPQALILGSSHCMRLCPAVVEKATGLSTFNLSVNSGKMEDFLALLEYALNDAGLKPRLILLGVCPRTFCRLQDERFDDRLISNLTLMRHVPLHPLRQAQKKAALYAGTLNLNYLIDVRTSLRLSRQQDLPLAKYKFEADGFLKREEPYNPPDAFLAGPLQRERTITGFAPQRARYFDLFLAICRRRDIAVKVIITPYAPNYIAAVDRLDGSYSRLHNLLLEFLTEHNRDGVCELWDFSRIENYGGIDEFMGSSHASIRNSTLMLDRVFTKEH
ncbi:MAG: hypothetical protein MUC88_15055 [Planctomycetes bacterium]|jgi:hypothetical protein|nr:hypothetical protein [Planctomycetota bacterium]